MTAQPIPPAPGPLDPAPPASGASRPRPTSPVLGILLVVPMLLATLVCVGWPSIDALVRALVGAETPFGGSTGAARWDAVLADAGSLAVAGIAQTLPALVAGTLVAIPIAQALAVGALAARIATAVLVALPMPLAASAWWALGPGEVGPPGALGVATVALLPTVAGIAAIVLVPVVRAGLRALPTVLTAVAIGAAVAAVGLQSSSTSVFAAGSAATLPARSFEVGFQRFELADAAAYDVLVLVSLGALGIAVVALLAVLRPAVAVAPVAAARSSLPLAATMGSLVSAIVAAVAIAMPVLLVVGGDPSGGLLAALVPAVVGTWVPALLGAVVATLLAVAAAIGIGWLAPFGRHSLWLLLPFAPALLVSAAPLVASAYLERMQLGAGLLSMVPTIVVSVPLLVALTLLTAGMRRAGRLDVATLAWASLVGFAVLAATNAQALQPARVLATIEESSIVLQLASIASFAGNGAAVGVVALATSVPIGLLLGALVVLGLGAVRGATLVLGDGPLPTDASPQPPQAWVGQPPQLGTSAPPGPPGPPAPPAPGTQVPPPGWTPPVAPPPQP